MPDPIRFPFSARTQQIQLTKPQQRWWKKNRPRWTFPVPVTFDGRFAQIADSRYELFPQGAGYACRRPKSSILVGYIYPYGVRQSLTPSLQKELAMIRAALWGKSYPAPLCYDLIDGSRAHPGPCLEQLKDPHIVKVCYTLDEKRAYTCVVCNERFL